MKRNRALTATIVVATSLLSLIPVATANAAGSEIPSRIDFVAKDPTVASFGDDWLVKVQLRPAVEGTMWEGFTRGIGPEDGTVEFRVSGQPDTFADDIAIYPGGVAYLAQPDSEPLLEPGNYTITAIFTPSAAGDFATSKTRTTAKLSIEALTITPEFTLVDDRSVSAVPLIRTEIGGSFVDKTGAPPAGEWAVSATDSSGDEVFSRTVAQPTESESGEVGPLDIPIDTALKSNTTFEVRAVFTPDSTLAHGLSFENPQAASLQTAPPSIEERLATPLPWWFMIIAAMFLLGALILVVILTVKTVRAKKAAQVTAVGATVDPGAPTPALPSTPAIAPHVASAPPAAATPAVATPAAESWAISEIFADETAPNEMPTKKTW